jgi:D-beta-D-heptose 7-phosphate kinase/D-beta-D-heptose 1-phosphate adenosyltransferase
VLVVGDVMLDTYVHGTVSRISPEAPVPVVHHEREQSLPGGAANTAMNLATLGAKVTLLSVTGDDRESRILKKMMEKEQIRSGFLPDASRFTTQKTRIVSHGWHQIVRLDHEVAHPLASSLEKKLLTKISALLPKHQALLLSDYGKGVLTPPVLQGCIRMAQRLRIPVVLDPKPRDAGYARYVRGVTVMTPNSREAQIMCQSSARDPKTLAKKLSGMTQSNVLVTLGADGMCLYERSGTSQLLPALTSDVADVSGAGDTVSAMIALTLATQGSLRDGVDLSNRAASIVVRKQGTAVLSREELLRTL